MSLAGLSVLVTRPGRGGEELFDAVRKAGAKAALFSAIEFEAQDPPAQALRRLETRDRAPLCIFISPHAVDFAMAWAQRHQLRKLIERSDVAATGAGTAAALRRHGLKGVTYPERQTGAVALLERCNPEELRERDVIVFRGVGGKAWLGNELRARGAALTCVEVYRRCPPERPLSLEVLGDSNAVVVTSAEALSNLYGALSEGAVARFRQLQLFVTSEQAVTIALAHGQAISPIITTAVGNAQILRELELWWTNPR